MFLNKNKANAKTEISVFTWAYVCIWEHKTELQECSSNGHMEGYTSVGAETSQRDRQGVAGRWGTKNVCALCPIFWAVTAAERESSVYGDSLNLPCVTLPFLIESFHLFYLPTTVFLPPLFQLPSSTSHLSSSPNLILLCFCSEERGRPPMGGHKAWLIKLRQDQVTPLHQDW